MPEDIGRYQLLEELGRGGMGRVWRAFDRELRRFVAIKVLAPLGFEPDDSEERFRHEARAVARLRSPHVVEVHDFGVSAQGQPYLVMELLEGETLRMRLQRVRAFSLDSLKPIVEGVARGLSASHAAGVVHRDLKPDNLFFSVQGGQTLVKILDFGVAQILSERHSSEITAESLLPGTPAYVSPEQVAGREADPRSDLWALAVITYEALTGQHPFQSGNLASLLQRICTHCPPLPSQALRGLPKSVDAFFARALSKEPAERYQSAQEFSNHFSRLGQDEARPTCVLVVDDEPDMQLLIEQCFEQEIEQGEYQFCFAANGAEALLLLEQRREIGVTLTDLNMPAVDGFQFLSRAPALTPSMRAVVVTAYGDMTNVRRAMNCGAFDFLLKPIDFSDLKRTLEKAANEALSSARAVAAADENLALRSMLDQQELSHLLPLLRTTGGAAVETFEGSVCSLRVWSERGVAGSGMAVYDACFDLVASLVQRNGGSIFRFNGESALVLFRDADHSVRAIQTLSSVRRAVTSEPSLSGSVDISAGIDAGEITLATVGAPSQHRFNYGLFGEAAAGARMLEVAAGRGSVLVSGTLARGLAGQIRCKSVTVALPLAPLQGVFEVVGGAAASLDVARGAESTLEITKPLVTQGGSSL